MRTTVRLLSVLLLVGFGYALGTMRLFEPKTVHAQPAAVETPEDKVKTAYKSLESAQQALQQDGKYRPVVDGVNAFAVTVGGVNAQQDLEDGTGVDPETFAALYAGRATGDVAKKLGTDDQGRLTYNKRVIRMYSVDRLKKLYKKRAELSGLKRNELKKLGY